MFSFERQASLILFLQEVMSAEKEIEFQAAVRGFHYYRKYWKPKEGELLFCSHDFGNPFDVFAIKTCTDEGNIVGHLPREISRASKFLLDGGTVMNAKLSSSHYRRSPLVQGGMEIPCKITVKMRPTIKNCEILKRFLDLVTSMYAEPEVPLILGSILMYDLIMSPEPAPPSDAKKRKKVVGAKDKAARCPDIRVLFQKQAERNKKHDEGTVSEGAICID